jgi:hypothetical protein
LIIIYTPEGGEPEQYDASTLRVSEAAIVQRTIDMKWQEILQGLEADDLDAMRGIVWVMKKRQEPALRFGDFDPGVTELIGRLSTAEVESYIDQAFAAPEANPDISRDMVADILRGRLPQLAADPDHAMALLEARAKGPKAGEPEQPADEENQPGEPSSPSPTSSEPEPSTSDSSPTSSTSPLLASTTSSSATSTP